MKRILVGIGDPRYSISASEAAIELAKRFDAKVTALGVVDLVRLHNVGAVPIGGGAAANSLRRKRQEQARQAIAEGLDEFTRRCREAGVEYGAQREAGDAIRTLTDAARYHDLLICGLGGMFEHGVVDEPKEELRLIIESGVRPMIAVTGQYRKVSRVLVAYSGSIESAATLRQYAQIRPYPDAEHRLVTFGEANPQHQTLVDEAGEYLLAHDVKAAREVVPDDPRRALLSYASGWGADLIVIGNSAKSLLRRRVFGETALEAMRSSEVTLFLGQ